MPYDYATRFAQRPLRYPGQIRLESYEAVKRLNAKGADVATLTGDSQAVAIWLPGLPSEPASSCPRGSGA
jgi:hypothetical protein